MEALSASQPADDAVERRSRALLLGGLAAVRRGDLDAADDFLLALERGGA